jgi:transketolase
MKELIKKVLDVAYNAKEGHIPSSLSILDILYVLYDKILTKDDYFILSKGHASVGLYVILDHFNLLEEDLNNFCKFDSKLGGHPSDRAKNIFASTGSLGHGLPIGVGIAMGNKIQKNDKKTYVIIGDGESNEGTIWESALLASNHKLNNLYCIMDYNHSNDRALLLDDIKSKFISFGWDCIEVDGHNHEQLLNALSTTSDKPIFVLANTIKGNGIKSIENKHEWHHKIPNKEQYELFMEEIEEIKFKEFLNDKLKFKIDPAQTDLESYNLSKYVKKTNELDGDIVEVGVLDGGTAQILLKYKSPNKKIYLFDTFEGLQDTIVDKDGTYLHNTLFATSYGGVVELFKDNQDVSITKGYFPETDEILNDVKISLAHLDVDTYQSTLNCLNYLYPKMVSGGVFIIHDWINNPQVTGVKLAVDEFLMDKSEKVFIGEDTQGVVIKL